MAQEENKLWTVEKVFLYCNLVCVCVLQAQGYRCGYVGIDQNNYLYGKSLTDYIYKGKVFNPITIAENDLESIGTYFDVHGGLTYAEGINQIDYPIEGNLWWFGFDCHHVIDKIDYPTTNRLFEDNHKAIRLLQSAYRDEEDILKGIEDATIKTLDFVENECCRLARQLIKFQRPNSEIKVIMSLDEEN